MPPTDRPKWEVQLLEMVKEHSTPMPLYDDNHELAYVVLEVKVVPSPAGDGFRAFLEDFITLYGEGETKEEARQALYALLPR